jgi:hypothetical protein
MRKLNRMALGLLMALVANFAVAAWSGSGKIQKIYFSSSRILIVHDLMADPDGCGRLDKYKKVTEGLFFSRLLRG